MRGILHDQHDALGLRFARPAVLVAGGAWRRIGATRTGSVKGSRALVKRARQMSAATPNAPRMMLGIQRGQVRGLR